MYVVRSSVASVVLRVIIVGAAFFIKISDSGLKELPLSGKDTRTSYFNTMHIGHSDR